MNQPFSAEQKAYYLGVTHATTGHAPTPPEDGEDGIFAFQISDTRDGMVVSLDFFLCAETLRRLPSAKSPPPESASRFLPLEPRILEALVGFLSRRS